MRGLTSVSRAQPPLLVALVLAAAVGVGVAVAVDRDTGSGPGASPGRTTLPVRVTTAGPVRIKVTPVRLGATGAAFEVTLDNHQDDLMMDIARGASLTVGQLPWSPASWSGDGPGGHHREGTLTFPASSAATGRVLLRLVGFPDPVQLGWTLPEGGARS